MTTVADVLARCRNDYLLTGTREQRNKLAGAIDASVTTITCAYDLASVALGSKVSVGLEDLYVWDANTSTKTLTVNRGDFGTTAATHADGSIVTINSRHSDAAILRAINTCLAMLSSPSNGLFQVKTVDLTFNAAVDGYDLTAVTNVIQILGVRYQAVGSANEWPVISSNEWEHQRNLDTALFPSGQGLFIRGYADPGRTVRVTYKAPFSPLATLADDVLGVSGLHTEAHDLLALGAAVDLVAGREVNRNRDDSQGDTRRAGEVPPGAQLGGWRALAALFQQRVREEAARLGVQYPMRVRA